MSKRRIPQALEPLVGLPLRCIGRAANIVWFHFGKLREVPGYGGGTKLVGQYAVHVQCVWRLVCRGRILIAYRDFYYSAKGKPLEDWDSSSKSRFDILARRLSSQLESSAPLVRSVKADDVGGFSIVLSRGYRLDVFPDSSDRDGEDWRIFQPASRSRHFVVP